MSSPNAWTPATANNGHSNPAANDTRAIARRLIWWESRFANAVQVIANTTSTHPTE